MKENSFELNTRKNSAIKERDRNEALDEIKKKCRKQKELMIYKKGYLMKTFVKNLRENKIIGILIIIEKSLNINVTGKTI